MKNLVFGLLALSLSIAASANDTGAWFDPEQDGHGISLFEFERDGEMTRVFWWYAHHPTFGQTWLMSSVERGDVFVLYRPTAAAFPTSDDITVGTPIGTAELVKTADGTFVFVWDLLAEDVTCEDKYGPVPPGPRDPACLDEENRFVPDRVLVEGGFDYQGTARLRRLTPAQ